ncbi:hypothetical protein A2U01_0100741, partial [Trifolium medium]|nr:hypothetical protein [Trifolium medium]
SDLAVNGFFVPDSEKLGS